MLRSILLVDDNPAVLNATSHFLQQSGFVVCGKASDGLEAIEKAVTLSPNLIVMDLSMPRMNGLQAATKLTKRLPLVPIILLTSYKTAIDDSDIAAAGIFSVISKTDSPELLRAEIRKLLDMPLDEFLTRRGQISSRAGFGY